MRRETGRVSPGVFPSEDVLVLFEIRKRLELVALELVSRLDLRMDEAYVHRDAVLRSAEVGDGLAQIDHAFQVADRRDEETELRLERQLRCEFDLEVRPEV